MRRVVAPDTMSLDEIRALAQARFGDMIKGVVDLERGVLLLDADLHADQEATLLADGSKQTNLWGINLYPDVVGDDWLEFDSMINLRPSFGNRSRGVDDAATPEDGSTGPSLQKYFDQFALAARRDTNLNRRCSRP